MKKTRNEIRTQLWEKRKKDGVCVYCGLKKAEDNVIGCGECLKKKSEQQGNYSKNNNERTSLYRKKIKKEVMDKYGGSCTCCGELELMFLTIDHINNDGHIERKEISKGGNSVSSTQVYLKLRKEPIRDDIQVLCFNCNLGRSMNGGVCPHNKPSAISFEKLEDLRNIKKFDQRCKIEWSDTLTLIKDINDNGIIVVATKLGVHQTAIRNRIKRRELNHLLIKRTNQHG